KRKSNIGIVSDFFIVDSVNRCTRVLYYELAESVRLPTFAALSLVDDLLHKYGIRYQTYIIASGQLVTPDKIAIALALGADLINIARGFMLSVVFIMALVCQTNNCPAGVATTDPKLQQGLNIQEK